MPAAAAGPEALRAGAERQFGVIPYQLKDFKAELDNRRTVLKGPLLGAFSLAERLDAHRNLLTKQLGAVTYDVALANDTTFKVQYFSFRSRDRLFFKRIESWERVRNEGVTVELDPKTTYKIKIVANVFDPSRGSKFKMDPVAPTQGPTHNFTTGELLDRIRAKSFLFKVGKTEYQVLYGTDVDAATETVAATRHFLITLEAGMSTKGWPVPEQSLALDQPTRIGLDQTQVVLTRTSSGQLLIHAAAK